MRNNFIILTLIFAAAAFVLSPILWPSPTGTMGPGAGLIPLFIIYSIFESLAFGIGMAFLILYWKRFTNHQLVFLSVVWMLISWWPHDNFHRVLAHDNFVGLLALEYGFHFTLILAGVVVAKHLVDNLKK